MIEDYAYVKNEVSRTLSAGFNGKMISPETTDLLLEQCPDMTAPQIINMVKKFVSSYIYQTFTIGNILSFRNKNSNVVENHIWLRFIQFYEKNQDKKTEDNIIPYITLTKLGKDSYQRLYAAYGKNWIAKEININAGIKPNQASKYLHRISELEKEHNAVCYDSAFSSEDEITDHWIEIKEFLKVIENIP